MVKKIDVDDVNGMLGEDNCTSNGNLLIELLQNCNLMICNGRTLLCDTHWTRVKSCLGHKSTIDCIITEKALIKAWSNFFLDRTIIGSSDHYLVWLELERKFSKGKKKAMLILYKWWVNRLQDKAIRNEHQIEWAWSSIEQFVCKL